MACGHFCSLQSNKCKNNNLVKCIEKSYKCLHGLSAPSKAVRHHPPPALLLGVWSAYYWLVTRDRLQSVMMSGVPLLPAPHRHIAGGGPLGPGLLAPLLGHGNWNNVDSLIWRGTSIFPLMLPAGLYKKPSQTQEAGSAFQRGSGAQTGAMSALLYCALNTILRHLLKHCQQLLYCGVLHCTGHYWQLGRPRRLFWQPGFFSGFKQAHLMICHLFCIIQGAKLQQRCRHFLHKFNGRLKA